MLINQAKRELKRSYPIDRLKIQKPGVPETAQPTTEQDSDPLYDVDDILADRIRNAGRVEYLVKWSGYSNSQATWEPEGQFVDLTPVEIYWKRLEDKISSQSPRLDPGEM